MKKTIVMLATLIMSFAFAISVMAAPSPEDEHDDDNGPTTTSQKKETQEKIDKKTKITEDEFGKDGDNGSSSSPKTGDQGAPVTLVYVSLAAAALAVYAAKHVQEQN